MLLAAGRGTRLGAEMPKAYLPLDGVPLLVHCTARLLAAAPSGDECHLFVLVHPDDRESFLAPHLQRLRQLTGDDSRLHVVDGGASRQESMDRGLAATAPDTDLVLVHDAARALVPVERTRECLTTAAAVGAALLAVPASDTLKRVRDGKVEQTLDRSQIWYAQTPQIARRDLYLRACEHARTSGFAGTDDSSLLERAGIDVAVVTGAASNLKITRPDDLPLAESLLERDPTPFPDRQS